jgi:hypothetical protein
MLVMLFFMSCPSFAFASQPDPFDSNQIMQTYKQEAQKALALRDSVYEKIAGLDEQEEELVYQYLREELTRPLELWRLILLDYPRLRLLRNEIYARHGRTFSSADLATYFSGQSWYKPDPAFVEANLSTTEKENIRALARVEFVKYHGHTQLGEQIQFPSQEEPESVTLSDMGLTITRNYTGC